MTTEKSKINYSRMKARKKFKKHFPSINLAGIHIHHLDGNPMNNEISNLCPISAKAHLGWHNSGASRDIDLNKDINRLESLLIIYNDR